MRRLLMIGLSLAFIIPISSWPDHNKKTSEKKEIPLQISEFYKDCNFISSFSSRDEREELIAYLSKKELPKEHKSERLEKVFQLMQNVKSKIMISDPGMIIQTMPSSEQIFRSALTEVRKIQKGDQETAVEVLVCALAPEENFRYISQYDENRGDERKIPSEEERIESAKSKLRFAPVIEIHKWLLIDGRWMKQDANVLLLKDKK